jgi:hypothetical protein
MKKLLAVAVVAVMLFIASPASAWPSYESDWNRRHGWIVKVHNDRNYWIRTRCRWWAGSNWTWSVRLPPHYFKWTTSDAGGWGNRRPQNLHCSFVRI